MADANVLQMRRRRPPKQDEVLLTVHEAAQRLKVDDSTVRRWIRQGIVPHVRLGDGGQNAPVRIPLARLDDWWGKRVSEGRL